MGIEPFMVLEYSHSSRPMHTEVGRSLGLAFVPIILHGGPASPDDQTFNAQCGVQWRISRATPRALSREACRVGALWEPLGKRSTFHFSPSRV